jgi:hypothetical protein
MSTEGRLLALAMICFTLICLSMAGCQAYRTRLFVTGHYCDGVLPGHSDAVWVVCQ